MLIDNKKKPSKEESIKSILVFLGEDSDFPKEKMEEEEEDEEEKKKKKPSLPMGQDILSMLKGL